MCGFGGEALAVGGGAEAVVGFEAAGEAALVGPADRAPDSGDRLVENFDVFDFELTTAELKGLDALDTGVRGGPEPDDVTLEAYGRAIPEA